MSLPSPYVVTLQFGSSGDVDITSYVNSVSINRGISRQLEDYSAGSVSVTFVNNSRIFDPLNTSSPLWYGAGGYTMVQPGGEIRISSNGVRRFTGSVQDWQFTFDDSGLDAQATVTALDSLYNLSVKSFVDGVQEVVEPVSNKIKRNLSVYGSSTALINDGHTLVGSVVNSLGDSVLSYVQNLARSEPADFFGNASGVLELVDRSFTNYSWTNTVRNNLIKYPNTLSQDTTIIPAEGGTGLGDGWVLGWQPGTALPIYGGTVNTAEIYLSTRTMYYQEVNRPKINPSGTATSYVFSSWFRGSGLTGAGITGSFVLLDSTANSLVSVSLFGSAATGNDWTQLKGTAIYGGTSVVAGFQVGLDAPGTTTAYNFIANGWQVEQGTVIGSYFDGNYNPFTSDTSTVYDVAWSGVPYATYSGLLTSTASTATPATYLTFADQNSQGASFGNGTGIPFTDLQVIYGSEQLYNQIQVVGVNATATVSDASFQGDTFYGVRTYSQTDNLTTSTSKPAEIATRFLSQFRKPEYRAQEITVALEALTVTQQTLVLGVEIRDVIRVCFQPSATGAVVDKYYEVLGVNASADTERDHITFNVSSLDNMPFTLDSPILGVLDTDTLG